MRRRLLALPVAAGVVAGGTALAQGGPDPYQLPEPDVRSGQVLRLAAAGGCDRDRLVRVRFTPPAGAVFGWFEVIVRGHDRVRLTGVARSASATVRLARGRSAVQVAGETLGGQRVAAERVYRTCAPRPAARPAPTGPPIQQGGGED